MRLPYHIVDAFTRRCAETRPVPPAELMQSIAAQNNLSDTAFVVPEDDCWNLRRFTPAIEVELCGHATQVSAFVLESLGSRLR